MTAKVFINARSGGVAAVGAEKISSLIFHALKAAEIDCRITTTEGDGIAEFCDRAKSEADTTIAIIAGGDGTLAAAAGEFAGADTPVFLLPGGTMNLIAHDLGVGGDMERAVALIADSRPRLIDVGMANGRAFLNNVVFGDYAQIAQYRERIREAASLNERIGAISEATETLLNSSPAHFNVTLDDRCVAIASNILMVSNNRYAGAVDMRPRRERLDGGKLAVYLAESAGGVDMIARMIEAVRGELERSEAVECLESRRCVVDNSAKTGLVAVDGEPQEFDFPVEITIKPRALAILCPG